MALSNCACCDSKKLRLIKEEEAKGFLGSTLGKVAILGTLPI